jgi:hypothetical protein
VAEETVHYDRKPIRTDQCSTEGNEERAGAVPLRSPEAG